jgi:hypothetical protein
MSSDMSSVQQVQQKLAPLLSMLGGTSPVGTAPGGPQANPQMMLDSTLAEPSSPTYFSSLNQLLVAQTVVAEQIVRSATGGYTAPLAPSRTAQSESTNATDKPDNTVVGLGFFNPRTYMKNSKDGGSNDRDESSRNSQGPTNVPITQVSLISQLLQAQQLFQNRLGGNSSLVTPISKDGVTFNGITPTEVTNSFDELMLELAHRLASDLSGTSEASGAASANPLALFAQVPNGASASTPEPEQMMRVLEDAISLRMLQQSKNTGNNDKTNVMDAARLVLTALMQKIQNGQLQANPAMMAQVVDALQGVMSIQPDLANSGVGQKLGMMKMMLGALVQQQQTPEAATSENSSGAAIEQEVKELEALNTSAQSSDTSSSTNTQKSSEELGWKPVTVGARDLIQAPDVLNKSKNYNTIAAGSVNSNGTVTGVGLGNNTMDNFAYQLKPDAQGNVKILNSAANKSNAFNVSAKMSLDDNGSATSLGEGVISWNGGKDAIRMNSDGVGEISNNSGKSWSALSNEEKSLYTSSDKQVMVSYDPVDRQVQLLTKDGSGNRTGSATMEADGSSVSFSNLSSGSPASVG